MDEFIKILRNAGLEPTGIELAEMLLLAACLPSSAVAAAAATPSELDEDLKGGRELDRMRGEKKKSAGDAGASPTPRPALPGGLFADAADDAPDAEGGVETVPFRAPKAPALPGAQRIARALRPLRRRFPSPRHFEFDEEKTIRRIADGGPISPVMTPASERWLDLALVMDRSLTMQLWRPTLGEARRLFERSGIFRNVRFWDLSTEGPRATLHSLAGPNASPAARGWRELLDPTGRTLIVVISDCHAESWRNGDAWRLLVDWGEASPVGLIQVLPERFWPSTTMTPVDATLRAERPGLVNSRLAITPAWYGELLREGGLPLPILTLDEWSIGPWARMVAGASGVSSFGLVIPPLPAREAARPAPPQPVQPEPAIEEPTSPPEPINALFSQASRMARRLTDYLASFGFMTPRSSGTGSEPPATPQMDRPSGAFPLSRDRVESFFAQASPMARQLAGYLAAAPLSLPVMHLVQQAMLPASRQSHLAEVFLGGLMYQPAPGEGRGQKPDEILFEFYEGVRDELINRVTKAETVMVIDLVSRYIEERLGEGGEFGALLAVPGLDAGGPRRRLDPLSRRFAQLSARILRRFGGYESRLARIEALLRSEPASAATSGEFEFTTVTLDAKGQEIERRTGRARAVVEVLGPLRIELVELPGGEFWMGSTEKDAQTAFNENKRYNKDARKEWYDAEVPRHRVKLSPFLMGKYPVTQAQWKEVMGKLPEIKEKLRGDDDPVVNVSWEEANEFCKKLSERTGQQYRLPTEAEWEYAARAGTTTPFAFGENINPEIVNYWGEKPYGEAWPGIDRDRSVPVGSLGVANGFGLYDMHGNVWEWCADWYDAKYYAQCETQGIVVDPQGPRAGSRRVIRGGSWNDFAVFCRSAHRDDVSPGYRYDNLGFRLVRVGRIP